jgi:hypothetical protein
VRHGAKAPSADDERGAPSAWKLIVHRGAVAPLAHHERAALRACNVVVGAAAPKRDAVPAL